MRTPSTSTADIEATSRDRPAVQAGVVGADEHAVGGAPDVDLDAVGAVAQRAVDSGKGVLWMGWAGGTAVSEDEHTATVARRCVVLPSSTRPQCERVEHSGSEWAEPERPRR